MGKEIGIGTQRSFKWLITYCSLTLGGSSPPCVKGAVITSADYMRKLTLKTINK
jgi:hypothetical protein